MSRKRLFRILALALGLNLALTLGLNLTSAIMVYAQPPDWDCHIEWAPMRDGVKLATEVYLPIGQPGPFPVILTRSPYNEIPPNPGSDCNNAQYGFLASNGYAVLNQDVRGMYRSEGTFNAMVQEANDGYDAIEWAAAQPWSTGKVGTIGPSYVGLTQWQPAIHTPPHLKAMAPWITASDYHDNWTYVNADFDLWFAQSWLLLTFAPETYKRDLIAEGLTPEEANDQVSEWITQGRSDILTEWVWELPLNSFDEFRDLAPYYYDWLAHPTYDKFWARLDVEKRYSRVTVPALNLGGWYDIFQVGTVRNFKGMQEEGGSRAARKGSKLIMWATCHACPAGTYAGDIDFGPNNNVDQNALYVRWFDRWLKGIKNGIDSEPAVDLFVMVPPDTGTEGGGFWVTGDDFPLPGTQTMKFYLRSQGHANTRSGDGVLVSAGHNKDADDYDRWKKDAYKWKQAFHGKGYGEDHGRDHDQSAADMFVYDPSNPVPTLGGNMCCINDLNPSGAFDQSTIETRDDVLVYTSEPLTQDLAVIGHVKVNLWAKSSTRDTDFTAKLVDVHPDGFAQNILDRIVRAQFRHGSKKKPSLIQPEKPYEYQIDLGYTGTMFKAGHQIRLEISSSNFPHYARNLNTGKDPAKDDHIKIARQTIMHDSKHSSYLELQVVPSVTIPEP